MGSVWIGATICLALLCSVSIWALYRPRPNTELSKIEVVPLVGLRGFQATPAFSPDGTLVAFRQSDGGRHTGIYAAVVGGDKSIQLTSGSGDCCPTWSPDGSQIAFSRYSDDNVFSIYTVPALGGTERRVYRGPDHMGGGLSWSPDGRLIAFTESREKRSHAGVDVGALSGRLKHSGDFVSTAGMDRPVADVFARWEADCIHSLQRRWSQQRYLRDGGEWRAREAADL
jgi:hypothetical protein